MTYHRCAPCSVRFVLANLTMSYKELFFKFSSFYCLRNSILDNSEREYKNLPESQVLKGTRWLLLKNPENLYQQPDRNEKQRLDKTLKINEPLAKAYYLKDSLREFWCQSNLEAASAHIHQWIEDALATKIVPIMKFAKRIKGHLFGLLNWYEHLLSTGPLEGTNNKIKTLQRKAYGFRDREFFKLKIYTLHEARYALV